MTGKILPAVSPEVVGVNWWRAAVKGIPYIGASLDEIMFARLDGARWNRLERTLDELGRVMREREIAADEIEKEEFARLLEDTAPAIARATDERKRRMLRSLLLNAVTLDRGDPKWESARLAAELLERLDYAATEILAALALLDARGEEPRAEIRVPRDSGPPSVALIGTSDEAIELSYDRHVVDQAYKKLTDGRARLVFSGAHGRDKYERVGLADLGEFLIDWVMSDSSGTRSSADEEG
jgi:hypothetical protein